VLVGPGTRLVALLGDPVDHSLSPLIQNAAIRAAGVDAVYLALRCTAGDLGGLLRGIARAGGAGNVTIPHKNRAARALDVATRAVERTGACNTFWLDGDRVRGDNTDVAGFAAAARDLIGSPAGARVLVLGAGGAASAVVLALLEVRADAVSLLARSPDRARQLQERLDPDGRRVRVVGHDVELRREGYDLVVNATPLGLNPDDPHPVDLHRPARVGAVLDLTYHPGGTAWVAAAHAVGIPAADGTGMLIHQAAAAFHCWFGAEADIAVMRQALD
jgi:shikimate dehydrogenase